MSTLRLSRIEFWLAALTLCAFALQTDDFVIVGVLPAIADGLAVSEATAGQLVTVFSAVCAVVAPVAAVVTASWPRRRTLTFGLSVFCAANFGVVVATSYPILLGLRIVAALAAAVTLPTVFAVAAALAPAERLGRSLATVTAGLTGAVVIGVPLGTWVGAAFGWQATFVLGGLLGLVALIGVRAGVPDVAPAPAAGIAERISPLANRAVLGVLLAAVVAVAGNLMLQTYLAPLLHALAGVTPTVLGGLLVMTGVAGIAGARATGSLIDRFGAGKVFVLAAGTFAAATAGLAVGWSVRPVPLGAVVPLLLAWSAAAWSVPPLVQTRVLRLAGPGTGAQALALSSSAVYLGASLGGGIGGWLLTAHDPGALPIAAGGCVLVALALFSAAGRITSRPAERPDQVDSAEAEPVGVRGGVD